MNVLFINHTSQISGGERSLLDVLHALPEHVSPAVACPEGPFAAAVRRQGVPVFPIPEAEGSLRLHPVYTLPGIGAILRAAVAVRTLAARFGADVLHANSIRAGIIASLAHQLGAPPAVVYVRDSLPSGVASALSLRTMQRGAATLLPNSHYTAASLSNGSRAPVRVVHSPIDFRRFEPSAADGERIRRELGLASDDVVLVVVAQLTPWKAQDDAIRIAALLRERHPGIRLLLVGSAKFLSKATRYDNRAYRGWLGKLVQALDVEDAVRFLGERDDVPAILAASDVALLPSWEEPFGRSVVEAMAMGCPVVATNVGGPPEIIADGREGILLPPRRPAVWANAIDELIRDPERRASLAGVGRERVESQFGVEQHVEAILEAYAELAERPSASGRRRHTPGRVQARETVAGTASGPAGRGARGGR